MNYDEMTIADLICELNITAHPEDDPSAECAAILDEAASRLASLERRLSSSIQSVEKIHESILLGDGAAGDLCREFLEKNG